MTRTKQKKQPKGLFLTFEGGEGSGKSTQAKLLQAWLEQKGLAVLVTREPGGTQLGAKVREIVLDHRTGFVSDRAELLLYEADRAQHVDQLLKPALLAGKVVLCDRFADSATVYQGICRGLGERQTRMLNRFATAGLTPDKVFVLDIPETEGLARARKRTGQLDRLEQEAMVFHKKVRAGFLKLARADRRRYVILDGRLPPEQIAARIQKSVAPLLKGRGL